MTTDFKKIIKIALLSILLLFMVFYGFFRSKDLIFGVKIKNVNITDGMKSDTDMLKISGNTKNVKVLTLDGREIFVDQAGNFEETIALHPGYNIVDIKAKDYFGGSDEKIYKVIY